jgi:FemAB-related protein (PEP-CTERM system-associated)
VSNVSNVSNVIEVVRQQGNGWKDAWDKFVSAADGSTFCHLSGWRSIMENALGHEAIYLVASDAESWRGVLPLVRVRSVLGHFLISMPFLNDGGPLGDLAAQSALVEYAVAEAKRSGAAVLELRARHDLGGSVASANRKITVMLPLPDSVEALWAQTFKAKLRSQVRRPSKEGMTARIGVDQLSPFYSVFGRNMRDLGTPVLPRAFFDQIAAAFGDRAIFSAVYSAEGAPAAAACSLVWRDEVEIVWASSLREFNKFSPNMLLYASIMEESIRRGASVFNFGRCTPGGATHKFKLQWGGHDVPLPWPSWSRKGNASPPSPDRPAFRVATAVWSRLPLAVANRLGPLLARQLP